MPARDRAAYMRAYRAKDQTAPSVGVEGPNLGQRDAERRIEELEAEVARLKRELALRPVREVTTRATVDIGGKWTHTPERNPYTEFHPAPKVRKK